MNEQLEQPIYQNLNVTIRKLNSDALENQDIKDFFNDTISYEDEIKDIKIITQIEPIVQEQQQEQKEEEEVKKISFSNLDAFKEYDPEILDEAIVFMNTSRQPSRIKCATIGFNGVRKILSGEDIYER